MSRNDKPQSETSDAVTSATSSPLPAGDDVAETTVVPAADQGAEVDLFRLPFRLLATSAQIGRQVTSDVFTRGLSVTRQVVDGARHGQSPADLANMVLEETVGTIRDVVGVAVEHAPAAEPMVGMAQSVAESLPSQVSSRISGATRLTSSLTGATVRDVRRQLREQGQELLRRSTELDDPEEHPSFRFILRQLAPDEARIVRFLANQGPQPVVDVVEYNGLTRDSREVSRHITLIGQESGCIRPENSGIYIDNLRRLGLVHVSDFRVGGQEAYDLLEAQPGVDDLPKPAGLMTKHRILYKSVSLSAFGRQLFEMCFAPDGDSAGVTG